MSKNKWFCEVFKSLLFSIKGIHIIILPKNVTVCIVLMLISVISILHKCDGKPYWSPNHTGINISTMYTYLCLYNKPNWKKKTNKQTHKQTNQQTNKNLQKMLLFFSNFMPTIIDAKQESVFWPPNSNNTGNVWFVFTAL